MRHLVLCVCASLAVAALFSCTHPGSEAPSEACASRTAAAPEARTAVPMPPKGPPVDNFRCHVCHINFADEELAVNHAEAGVGCAKCHGESDAHCGDEDNVTAPDIMYAKDAINPACMACHKVLPADHKAVIEGAAEKDKFCTDCHGAHKVAVRSRAWDKKTGRLIVR